MVPSPEETTHLARSFVRLAENRVLFVDEQKRKKQMLLQLRREMAEMPFRPKINAHSVKLVRQQSEQLLVDMKRAVLDAEKLYKRSQQTQESIKSPDSRLIASSGLR